MNSTSPGQAPRLHPLVATAAVAVTVFSLVGVAALTGVLPMGKTDAPAATASAPAVAAPPAAAPVAEPAKPVAKAVVKSVAKPPVAKVVSKPAPVATAPQAVVVPPPPPCPNCGRVDNIREVAQPGAASGLGAVAGGVVGGLLGNQVGKGSGNTIATVLGAAGGAYAGHQIEKSRKQATRYEIDVRMNDGSLRTMTQETVPVWRIGDRVKVLDEGLIAAD
ncbi:MAG: glycine zipper 2TM domain-containing protein [Pseudomonadota bacterium]